jgi:hypothetical protein
VRHVIHFLGNNFFIKSPSNGAIHTAKSNECVIVLWKKLACSGLIAGIYCNTISISGSIAISHPKIVTLFQYFFHQIACDIDAPKTACDIGSIGTILTISPLLAREEHTIYT